MTDFTRQYILSKLQERRNENNFRSLATSKGLVDFYSNDYLGFARSAELKRKIEEEIKSHPEAFTGSTGSRLLSGNNEYFEMLEKKIAAFHGSDTALIFNSGFDANYGLLSTLPYRGDSIIYDELIHASLHDGIRNSKADAISFEHNNLTALEEKLKTANGLKYVVAESVYSMDGSVAPLKQIAALCEKYNSELIVDEAHATGIRGEKGAGEVKSEIPDAKVLARVHTFSKALGVYGAVILCSSELKQFLINYCRPFIFSTALPFPVLAAIKCAYDFVEQADDKRQQLSSLIKIFREEIVRNEHVGLAPNDSPIQPLLISGNKEAKEIALRIQNEGLDVRAILYPTVAKGKERIRICLHSFNTMEEVSKLVRAINTIE